MTPPKLSSKPQAAAAATPPPGGRLGPARSAPSAPRRGRRGGLNAVARQFGGPAGPIGHLVTWQLALGNASFNRWLVREVAAVAPAPATVIELGCGPGVALRELLSAYPAARIVGVDPSATVPKSARRRNAQAIADGRLTLVTGDVAAAAGHAPASLALACHVLYFWADPEGELRRVRQLLAPGGQVALGYQLRQHMPPIAQRTFPQEGFALYDSDDQAAAVLRQAGFASPEIRVFGDPGHPGGRLALAKPHPDPVTTGGHDDVP